MRLKEGTLLKNGKYKVVGVLGQGGFGITYLASLRVHGNLGAFDTEITVAVKEFFMKSSCKRDADATQVCTSEGAQVDLVERFKRRFVKEARMLSSLHHEHIVPVTDVFEENNTVYYVMQYLEGGSLKKWVDKHGPMDEEQAKYYILQVGDALDYLHRIKKTCHFDVKPGNIMLNREGKAVLIDFGISRRYALDKDTSASAPVGLTAGFSPLEQYQGVMPVFSPSSDVYSLACTLYYILTGTVPPDAPTILDSGLSRPDVISPQCWEAISKAMKPVRSERLQSIREFVALLNFQQPAPEVDVLSQEPVASIQAADEPTEKPVAGIQEADVPTEKPVAGIQKFDEPIEKPVAGIQEVNVPSEKPVEGEHETDTELSHDGSDDEQPVPTTRPETDESTVVTPSGETDETTETPASTTRWWQMPVSRSTVYSILACLLAMVAVWVLYPRSKEVTDLSWSDSHQEPYQYSGSVRNGMPHGEGVARYADGRLYEGSFRKGLKDGKARFTDRRHSVFTGVYAADTIQSGRLDYHDGVIYFKGDFVGDQPYEGLWYYVKGDKPFIRLTQGKESMADE